MKELGAEPKAGKRERLLRALYDLLDSNERRVMFCLLVGYLPEVKP